MFNQFSNTRTGRKLASFKHAAEKSRYPRTWQDCAKHEFKFGPGYNRYDMNQGETVRSVPQYGGGVREIIEKHWILNFHCDGDDLPGIREFKKSHDLIRLNHTGWYGDDIQNETLCGIVAVFRWGHLVYVVPGVEYSDSDCDYLDFSQAYRMTPAECWDESGDKTDTLENAMRDAANSADSLAKNDAEENREADEEYRAEELCEQLTNSIKETRTEARALIKEIKTAGKSFSPAICGALREKLGELLGHVRKCREAIEKIEQSPYEYENFNSLV